MALSNLIPDLSETVDTHFSQLPPTELCSPTSTSCQEEAGYDFSRFHPLFEEHKRTVQEREVYMSRKKSVASEKTAPPLEEDEESSRWSLGISSFLFSRASRVIPGQVLCHALHVP